MLIDEEKEAESKGHSHPNRLDHSRDYSGSRHDPSGGAVRLQVTIIPAGSVSFKFQLVATYQDNSAETIFEKSTLPGLAILAKGKPVHDITALAVVAVATDRPLPAGAMAHFALNFTAMIANPQYGCSIVYGDPGPSSKVGTSQVLCTILPTSPPRVKWNYREVDSELISNGRLALVALPAFQVLGSDVFPVTPSQAESRRVDWIVRARVMVTAPPPYQQLSLLGSSEAFADFNWDGSITGGCTDCGTGGGGGTTTGSGTTIGGNVILETKLPEQTPICGGIGQPPCPTTTTTTVTATIEGPIAGPGVTPEELAQSIAMPGQTVLSVTVSSDGTIHQTVKSGERFTTTQRVSQETASTDRYGGTGFTGVSSRESKLYGGAQLAVVPTWRFDWGSTTYAVNWLEYAVLLGLIAAIAVGGFFAGYLIFRKKR